MATSLILLFLAHLLAGIYFKEEPSFINWGYFLTLMPRSHWKDRENV